VRVANINADQAAQGILLDIMHLYLADPNDIHFSDLSHATGQAYTAYNDAEKSSPETHVRLYHPFVDKTL